MARFYEVKDEVGDTNLPEEERKPRRAFRGTRGDAKKLGREWNDGKALRAGCGIDVVEHNITGGKPGLIAFLNELVGAAAPVKEKKQPQKADKAKKRK